MEFEKWSPAGDTLYLIKAQRLGWLESVVIRTTNRWNWGSACDMKRSAENLVEWHLAPPAYSDEARISEPGDYELYAISLTTGKTARLAFEVIQHSELRIA